MITDSLIIYPVRCTYTTNPEDREKLEKEGLRLKITSDDLLIFEESENNPIKVFEKAIIVKVNHHFVNYPDVRFPDDFNMPQCTSCGVYYPNADLCATCATLYIKDLLGIYETFKYSFKFEDRYYKEGFIKMISKLLQEQKF